MHHVNEMCFFSFVSEREGCRTIVRLDELPHHLTKCLIDLDAEMICTNCNIKITRRQYEMEDCDTHRATHEHNTNEDIDDIDEIEPLEWQIFENLTPMPMESRILKCDRSGDKAIAKTSFSLRPDRAIFGIHILRMHRGNKIAIGLTPTGQPIGIKGIGYWNSGHLICNGLKQRCGPKWGKGEIVTCAIMFPQNFTNDGNTTVEICFGVDGQVVIRREMVFPLSGLSPSIYMYSGRNTRPKIEFM